MNFIGSTPVGCGVESYGLINVFDFEPVPHAGRTQARTRIRRRPMNDLPDGLDLSDTSSGGIASSLTSTGFLSFHQQPSTTRNETPPMTTATNPRTFIGVTSRLAVPKQNSLSPKIGPAN
ncbi:hypothetical protein [Microbacterium profundi]|uniref:hypothetical protein n=1 Tax=Microbacterium profundi TaxID=450380 RepID=UPI00126A6AF3|nr:hypothetical protein [Microbacterium profundi]